MSPELRERVEQAFAVLARDGWITTLEPDTTGVVCREFDRNPRACGFAAFVPPASDDHAMFEIGAGVGDEDEDLAAAEVVATALRNAGLATTTELREGAACVTASLPASDTPEALAKRVGAFIRQQHGLPTGETLRVSVHGADGRVVWTGEVR